MQRGVRVIILLKRYRYFVSRRGTETTNHHVFLRKGLETIQATRDMLVSIARAFNVELLDLLSEIEKNSFYKVGLNNGLAARRRRNFYRHLNL